jgi:hypothetical protein
MMRGGKARRAYAARGHFVTGARRLAKGQQKGDPVLRVPFLLTYAVGVEDSLRVERKPTGLRPSVGELDFVSLRK